MSVSRHLRLSATIAISLLCCSLAIAASQEIAIVLTGREATRVIPTSFYYEGQSAPTQMRNSAAARFGTNRYVIVGLVDTSGYSTEVRAKYQGFFITDSAVNIGGNELPTGAYGFGFSSDGKFNVFDVGGKAVTSVGATKDTALRRPRPLMMVKEKDGVRLYAERSFVVITSK
ncbi:MAG TPA: hypothetical protein VFF31_30670 [Blastocatellia bacterium]|nr:hypothetical protein [Blastocatellia bacterium]